MKSILLMKNILRLLKRDPQNHRDLVIISESDSHTAMDGLYLERGELLPRDTLTSWLWFFS